MFLWTNVKKVRHYLFIHFGRNEPSNMMQKIQCVFVHRNICARVNTEGEGKMEAQRLTMIH